MRKIYCNSTENNGGWKIIAVFISLNVPLNYRLIFIEIKRHTSVLSWEFTVIGWLWLWDFWERVFVLWRLRIIYKRLSAIKRSPIRLWWLSIKVFVILLPAVDIFSGARPKHGPVHQRRTSVHNILLLHWKGNN